MSCWLTQFEFVWSQHVQGEHATETMDLQLLYLEGGLDLSSNFEQDAEMTASYNLTVHVGQLTFLINNITFTVQYPVEYTLVPQ